MKRSLPLVLALLATPAFAEDDFMQPVTDPLTQEECSACHMAYPAGFLPKASWNAILDTLGDHFGEDASLPADSVAQIRAYLTGAAPQNVRGVDNAAPILRISELGWFKREHGSRTQARAENNPAIGLMSNCAACHRGAEQGWFEDD